MYKMSVAYPKLRRDISTDCGTTNNTCIILHFQNERNTGDKVEAQWNWWLSVFSQQVQIRVAREETDNKTIPHSLKDLTQLLYE